MDTLSRRKFILRTAAGAGALEAANAFSNGRVAPVQPREFYTVLSLGRLGFSGTFEESVALAHQYGFEGVDPDAALFARLSDEDLKRRLDDLASKKLRLGAAGLPVDFRKDEATFNEGLKRLPDAAKALARAGVKRVSTWVLPSSNELTYLQNFRVHACRLRECARVLADHGQHFGLEYVAPRTFWRSERHPFIHTLSEMKELLVVIGTTNLGVQLDSWHWYNAEETAADLETLKATEIMTVDLNDAPRLPLDQQVDDHRELPAATGVIPIKEFLGALVEVGYDGPVQAEPFNARLRSMPREQAVAATAEALRKAFATAGLT
ncbi:MAG TPA: sugar phosphate isomerase/epimerase family protein [Terriglobia bacterium]|nr:sugar phosphate isomerase/epimerase family protein [Terriglobia bacterium]